MTHLKAFDDLDILLDKAQAPYHNGREKESICQSALYQWVKTHYKEYERTEKSREDIDTRLLIKKSFVNTSLINLNTVDKFFLIASLEGKWNFTCKGKVTMRGLPIVPATHDEILTIQNDPFQQPTNAFPRYEQYFDTTLNAPVVKIHSDTSPLTSELAYVKTPDPILDSTPNAICELPDWAMDEVLLLAASIALGIVENYPRVQQIEQVQIPKR